MFLVGIVLSQPGWVDDIMGFIGITNTVEDKVSVTSQVELKPIDVKSLDPNTLQFVTLKATDREELKDYELIHYYFSKNVVNVTNQFLGKNVFNPIPQALSTFEIISWFQKSIPTIGYVPLPTYKLLKDSGYMNDYSVVLYTKPETYSFIKSKTDKKECINIIFSEEKFKPSDRVFYSNEFENGGKVFRDSMLEKNSFLKVPKSIYYNHSEEKIKDILLSADPVYGFVFEQEAPYLLEQDENICVIKEHLAADLGGYFMVVHNSISEYFNFDENLDLYNNYITLLENKFVEVGFSDSDSFIKRVYNSAYKKETIDKVLKRLDVNYGNGEILPKLTFHNVKQRLNNVDPSQLISLILVNAGALSPYALIIAINFMKEIVLESELLNQFTLLGTSGGALSATFVAAVNDVNLITLDQLERMSDLSAYFQPNFRFLVLSMVTKHIYVLGFLGLIALLQILFILAFYAHKEKTIHMLRMFISLIGILSIVYLVPNVGVEYLLIVFYCWLLISLFLNFFYLEAKPVSGLYVIVVYLFFILLLLRFPLMNDSIFKSLDVRNMMNNFLVEAGDMDCATFEKEEHFAVCLLNKIKVPLVITAFDTVSKNIINFYYVPEGRDLETQNLWNWVDIRTCPDKFVEILESSAAIPLAFPTNNVECGNKNFSLVDGGVISDLALRQATEIGASLHFIMYNWPVDVANKFSYVYSDSFDSLSILSKYFMLQRMLAGYGTNLNLEFANDHEYYISQPDYEFFNSLSMYGGGDENGNFLEPKDLVRIGNNMFYSSDGMFTKISGGVRGINSYYEAHAEQLDQFEQYMEMMFKK